MAVNPILKSDLISDEALRALEEMSRLLREDKENMDALMASFKQYAGSIQPAVAANNSNNDALAAALQKVSELEKAYSDLQKLMKENAATQKAVAAEKRKYAKLTADEAESVKRLSENVETYIRLTNSQTQSLKGLAEVYAKNIVEIDIQKKSYNELYQTYNALKDALNKMTVEERLNTEAGKKLTEQSLKIRDTLNELQKSTGNYTLQVGKYRAAFDGLGYSFQQILREAPSALNLNQFFLAISNNIPMFLDQLKAFQDEQKEIKANLAQMTEGTKEYSEQLGKVMTVGQKLAKTLLSWQTLVLVGLLVIRNWDKIVNLAQKLFKKVEEGLDTMRRMRQVVNEIDEKVENSISKVVVELGELNNRLADVTQGSKEWMNITERIKEILGDSYDIAGKMPGEIQKITQAYIQQAEQLAKNKFVVDKIAENADKSFKRDRAIEMILKSGDVASAAKIFGYEEGSEQYKALAAAASTSMPLPSQTDANEKIWEVVDGKPRRVGYDKWMTNMLNRTFDELEGELFTNKDLEDLWKRYYVPMATNADNGSKGSSPTEQEMNNQFWKAAEARRNIMLVGYQKELADEKAAHLQQMQEQARANEEMQKVVEENVKNGFITREDGNRRIQELQKQNDDIMEGFILEHHKRVNEINTKYAEMDRQVLVEEQKGWIEELDEQYKVQDNNRKRRARTIKEEELANLRIVDSIQKMKDEIAALEALKLTQPEAIEQRTKRIEELNKAIEKLRQQIDVTKKLSNYKNPWDIVQRNGVFDSTPDMKKGILSSILGEDVVNAMSPDQVESAFETWLDNAGQAVTTWYNTTMGYIGDLMSAYTQLAEAKAEAAAKATEAAQEEYDKEKALLEAGYASRVEATWAEYQEKKAAQEQAEKDAKAAAEAEKSLNELSTMGSLIVASANIWKTFSKIPGVGVPLAIAALGTMWGSFAMAKAKAAEVSQYGEGGFEVLQGGSHASGHDIDLGVNNRRGRRMRAEGREGLGIFSIKAMNKYGAKEIEGVVNAFNNGTYEASVGRMMAIEGNLGKVVTMRPSVNLRRVESSLDKLVDYGSRSRTVAADGTIIEQRRNGTVTIHMR